MKVTENLPDTCECDLGSVQDHERADVLIPIRRLATTQESDRLDDELGVLLQAHFHGPLGRLSDAFTMTVSEMCDNATDHGRTELGAYVVAQRYKTTRCVLAIGDLGVGIPAHMRAAFPAVGDDVQAMREATKEGVTATGKASRGYGYMHVLEELKDRDVARAELRVWSGGVRFRFEARSGKTIARDAWAVSDDRVTAGTWIRVELSTRV